MPFRSAKQRRYLWSQRPDIARRWTQEHGSRVSKIDEDLALEPLPKDYESTKRRKLAEQDAFYRQPGRHKAPNTLGVSDSEQYDVDYGEFGRHSPHGQRNLARIKEGYRRSEQRYTKRTGKPYPRDTHALHLAMENQARADVGGKIPKKPKKVVQHNPNARSAASINRENEAMRQRVYRDAQRNSLVRKSSPLTLVEIGTTYGAISKGMFGNFFKPQKTVYGTTIKRSPAQRMGTAALAGTLALGGGAGAVKAAPAVAHGASSAGSSVTRAIGDKVDDVRYWGSSKDWRDSAPLMRSTAKRTGKPQTMSTLTRDDWVSAGRPGQKNGYVQYHRDDRTGVRTFMPDGSTTFSPKSPSQWPRNG